MKRRDLYIWTRTYYGGIKKYQWTTIPLALHGVVAKKDGTVVKISIGEKDDEPVFGHHRPADSSGRRADGEEGRCGHCW